MGAQVNLACRDVNKAAQAAKDIAKDTMETPETLLLDMANFASVVNFCDTFAKTHSRLDILVNNAGIECFKSEEEGRRDDGYEMDYKVNHLSTQLLTLRLLPSLKEASKEKIDGFVPRVVVVASAAAAWGTVDLENLNYEKSFPGFEARYCNSKLLNCMFTVQLARELEGSGVVAHCLNPGAVKTDLMKKDANPPLLACVFQFITFVIGITAEQDAMTSVHVAISDEAGETNGLYWDACKVAKYPSSQAMDADLVQNVWDHTMQELVHYV